MGTFDGFFETFGNLDWLAIIVAVVVVGVTVGTIFYGPTPIGKKWATAAGVPFSMKVDKRYLPGFLLALLIQIGVAYLGALDDIEHSLVTALVVTLFVVVPVRYGDVIWAKGSKTTALIDTTYIFGAFAVGGYVQGLFA
ncbi:MAG: DUF1761 family protein [Acidimicrobiia bacterium]